MRWLWLGVAASVGPLTGCSDDRDPAGLGDDLTTGEPPGFDYAACEPALQDPACVGTACGRTPEAEGYLALMLDVVAQAGHADAFSPVQAGHADAFSPVQAEYFPLVDELRIDYQLQVGWFRFATTVRFDVPDTETLLRQEMAGHVDGWRVPATVAPLDAIAAAVTGCDARLEYDPCEDNRPDFFVLDRRDQTEDGCVFETTSVVVDAADASALECVVEEPRPCP